VSVFDFRLDCVRGINERTHNNGFPLFPAPRIFETVTNIIRPLMSPGTRKGFAIFTTNKAEWEPYLHNLVDRDQLTVEYGGTKSKTTHRRNINETRGSNKYAS